MRYVLTLDANGRIWAAVPEKYSISDGVLVDSLPDGNLCDYLYVDGAYVYSPIPVQETEPTVEERVTALEDALAQTDETAIALYEAQVEQEEINAAQDEALIEIYEMMEG